MGAVMHYPTLLARLPLPTAGQTARFADHVADNHSWYKHLPFYPPGAAFVFFLNPSAGMGVHKVGDAYAAYDVGRGDYFEHHSRLATAEYLRQFGHWDYWVVENPRVREPQDGPWLYGVGSGGRARLPEDVCRRWRCRLTAFLEPSPDIFLLRPYEFQRETEAFAAYAAERPTDPEAARYGPLARDVGRGHDPQRPRTGYFDFMVAEALAQKAILLQTLGAVLDAYAEMQRGGA
jgi:hypothetical protein